MESNEISMVMDVKLDIPDKRPDSLKLKAWTRCDVKIEAIKCLPCFLRITFQSCATSTDDDDLPPRALSISINAAGLNISLAASRTKEYSYGLFWTQSRRDCYIYFALETETSLRRHMKWIKKSIKNLELHRQIFLEQRRSSRGPTQLSAQGVAIERWRAIVQSANSSPKPTGATKYTQGPLPQIPIADEGVANASTWSSRNSRVSDIYEEILENPPRVSRRFSHTSIASGIYEEMKPSASNFDSIFEEHSDGSMAPPLPPLPPPRKRVNTFETEVHGLLGEIPRCNTNPESEMAKKKKYKNVFDNIFGSGRSKRAGSVSETQTCSVEELIAGDGDSVASSTKSEKPKVIEEQASLPHEAVAQLKRNSFSSPDLSKINFLDTFDEEKIADILLQSYHASDDLNLSARSLDESSSAQSDLKAAQLKAESLESVNISQRIPNNFNFSACNTSKINLIGSNGAVPLLQNLHKNKVLVDDLTGYCFMAPIIKKKSSTNAGSAEPGSIRPLASIGSTSSGYSTGSHCSSVSSCANFLDGDREKESQPVSQASSIDKTAMATCSEKPAEESTIYMNMAGSLDGTASPATTSNNLNMETPPLERQFSSHLYENLLTVKAAQELEPKLPIVLTTSTPTESPLASGDLTVSTVSLDTRQAGEQGEEESFYQTPRKSIISVDEKIPSYYPNSSDSMKQNRRSQSPGKLDISTTPTSGLRHLGNGKLQRERKENLCNSSPQRNPESSCSGQSPSPAPEPTPLSRKLTKSLPKAKKAAAHKISEGVYAVRQHINKRTSAGGVATANNNNNAELSSDMKEQLQSELINLAILQNIDFKFDDTKAQEVARPVMGASPVEAKSGNQNLSRPAEASTRLLHKYAVLTKYGGTPGITNSSNSDSRITVASHHLQVNQTANTQPEGRSGDETIDSAHMIQSAKLDSPLATSAVQQHLVGSSIKKFASLPRFKRIDFSPLKLRINNVLQRNQSQGEF